MPLLPGKHIVQPLLFYLRSDINIVALYGLEVPCGDIIVPAVPDFPATVSILICGVQYRFVFNGRNSTDMLPMLTVPYYHGCHRS